MLTCLRIYLGIQMGRMFKPSWGRGLTLLTLNTRKQADEVPLNSPFEEIGSYVCGRSPEDTSSIAIVQRIQILGGNRTDDDRVKIFKVNFTFSMLRRIKNNNICIFVFIFYEYYLRKA